MVVTSGSEKLKKQVQKAAQQNDAGGPDSAIAPLLEAVNRLHPLPQLIRDIEAGITEEGKVLDSASEVLRSARYKVKAVESKITSILKGYPGEVSDRSGRMCIAAPAGECRPDVYCRTGRGTDN